jgi:hypothetical protein
MSDGVLIQSDTGRLLTVLYPPHHVPIQYCILEALTQDTIHVFSLLYYLT